jgi:hypothetical protein
LMGRNFHGLTAQHPLSMAEFLGRKDKPAPDSAKRKASWRNMKKCDRASRPEHAYPEAGVRETADAANVRTYNDFGTRLCTA